MAIDNYPRQSIKDINTNAFAQALVAWWQLERRSFPWRKKMPLWKALLTEVMLQRTRADQVSKSFRNLDSEYRVASQLSTMSVQDATRLFKPLGLVWRVPLFLRLAHEIARRKGRLRRTQDKLQELPGVGAYAAGAALSLHGGVRAVIIDSNTVRIVCRLKGIEPGPETRRKSWISDALEYLTPDTGFREFNYALLDLGAMICRPRSPECPRCPIQQFCATGIANAEK